MRGFLIHVGADTSNLKIGGPIFREGTFEFIPFNGSSLGSETYNQFPARNTSYGRCLGDFLPNNLAKLYVHYDPDFQFYTGHYTYCQPAEPDGSLDPKYMALRKMLLGDPIFFLASLAPYSKEALVTEYSLRKFQRGKRNKYVIGFFTLAGKAEVTSDGITDPSNIIGSVTEDVIKSTHHYQALSENKRGFILIQGSPKYSSLLIYALRITDKQSNGTFILNELGRAVLNRDTHPLRGTHWIDEKAVKLLARSICETNPKVMDKAKHLTYY